MCVTSGSPKKDGLPRKLTKKTLKNLPGWWFQRFLEFSPRTLGEDEPNLTIIFFRRGWFNHQLVNTFPLEMVPKIQVTFGGPPLFLFRGSPATWRKLISENLGDGCFVLGIIRFSKIPMEDCNTPLLRIPILHIGDVYWMSPLICVFVVTFYGFHLGKSPLFTTMGESKGAKFLERICFPQLNCNSDGKKSG